MMCCSRFKKRNQGGFSLLEMAVVLVILGLLLGGLLGPLSEQQRNKAQNQVEQQLIEIENALLGFAAANGRLPCPASAASNGDEARNGAGNCTNEHGFVPTLVLGLQGNTDANIRLLDPWLVPYRYSLSSVGTWEYAKDIQLNGSAATYQICSQSACSAVLAQNVVAVILSLGEGGNVATSSPDQLENTDADNVFVNRSPTEASGSEFNDSLRWISPNILIYQLVSAGQL